MLCWLFTVLALLWIGKGQQDCVNIAVLKDEKIP